MKHTIIAKKKAHAMYRDSSVVDSSSKVLCESSSKGADGVAEMPAKLQMNTPANCDRKKNERMTMISAQNGARCSLFFGEGAS